MRIAIVGNGSSLLKLRKGQEIVQHHSPNVEKEIIKNWEKEGKCRLIYQ